jgi:hypothetical protein
MKMKKYTQMKASPYLRDSELLWEWYVGLSAESRGYKSNHGEWSVDDVFRHFMLIEEMLVGQVTKRLASGKVKRSGLKNWRNAMLLLAALRIPKRYKAPAGVSESIESVEFILEDWRKVRKDLTDLLNDFPLEHMNGLVFKHPSAGPIRISDAMRFLHFHMRHHYPQLRSLAKRGGFVEF